MCIVGAAAIGSTLKAAASGNLRGCCEVLGLSLRAEGDRWAAAPCSFQLDSRKPLLACHPRPAHNGEGDGVVTPVCPTAGNKASCSTVSNGTTSCDGSPRTKRKGTRPVLVRRLRGVPGELLAVLQLWRTLSRLPVCLHAAYRVPRLPAANGTDGTAAAGLRRSYERGCKRRTLFVGQPKVRAVLHATHWIQRHLPRAGLQVLCP